MNIRIPLFAMALALLALSGREALALDGPPSEIDYQGTILKSDGHPYGSTGTSAPYTAAPENFTMQFRIYDQANGGTILWAQSQLVTVSLGKFSVRLGPGGLPIGNEPHPDLSTVFDGKNRYLGITIEAGVAPYGEISPRLAFLSAPYAFTAQKAVTATTASTALLANQVTQTSGTSTFDQVHLKTATVDTSVTAPKIEATVEVKAPSFNGNGAALTDLNAGRITAGTLNDGRLSSNVPLKNGSNTFTGINIFDGQNTFKGDGGGLTNLNAANLAAGTTINDARLSGEIIKNFALNSRMLFLHGAGDQNHVLRSGVGAPWNIDGPVLSGYGGGILACTNYTYNIWAPIVKWTFNDVTINRDLFIRDTLKGYPGRWRLYQASIGNSGDNGEEFRFQYIKDGDPIPPDTPSGHGSYFFIQKSGATGSTSDLRLKQDIVSIGSTLDSVLKLRPVTYRMKEFADMEPMPGFIAQEVQALFPDVVSVHDGYLGLSYQGLAIYVTKALQELAVETRQNAQDAEAKIKKLEEENSSLRRDLGDLERRLNALEAAAR